VTALSRNSSNLVKFIYDERGNVISARYSNGTYIAYEYDVDNRLTHTYDANSNWTSVVTGSGTISYQYDA
jgi:YD repeat-containing protein